MWAKHKQSGFTIVELLIVIVVIGILAAISIVAYNGVQSRANNAKRVSDLNGIAKALELYYIDNGTYPTTAYSTDPSICLSAPHWNCFSGTSPNRLVSTAYYASTIPQDPQYLDSAACGYPNSFATRAYWYATTADRKGYLLGAYLPGLETNHPNYMAPSSRGCGSFINYGIKGGNW